MTGELDSGDILGSLGIELRRDSDGLAIAGDGMVVRADFKRLLPRVRRGRLQGELLVRAARVKGVEDPVALDATAGLGEDSFLLAAAGFTVEMYERDRVIAALLRDGLERAAEDSELACIVRRMHLHEEDGAAALEAIGDGCWETSDGRETPDVVYLDPMFPERQKSAAVKKKLQLLQRLEEPCSDEDAALLLDAAISARPRKVVVKRPAKGAYLAGMKPAYSVEGKAVRFDCIVPANIPSSTGPR